jgi:hypothetical protein
MCDLLITTTESVMAVRGIPASDLEAFLEIQEAIMGGGGYVCKSCNGPAPMGVGYAYESTVAVVASLSIDACPCGRSALAEGVELFGYPMT